MKLACVRCKHKKIKCDRGEPVCHQCITADTECVYVERRKRPRLAQQKNDVRELNRRLEFLEQQIHGSEHASNSPRSVEESVEPEAETQAETYPDPSVPKENGKDSWIYRLASDTRKKFEKVNTMHHNTPTDTPDSHTVDDAISGLNDALDDLGNIRVRSEERLRRAPDLHITPEEARACIKIMKEMIASMVIPDVFVASLNLDILEYLPDLVNSPYVKVDPAIRVAYWNAVFYGLHKLHGPGNKKSKTAYLKLLDAVPEWLGGATGTDLDGHCATLTTWTTINNFDYQLSWKFHCRACHFLKLKGVDRLDLTPIRSNEEEDRRQSLRYLYWLVLQTDVLFRLFYGKPAAIKWKAGKVKPPTLFSTKCMNPSAAQSTIYVVWIRYTVLTAEVLDVLDSSPAGIKGPHSAEVIRQVDEYCSQLEELIEEWDLFSLMGKAKRAVLSWLYADHIMNIYTSIVGIRRLARSSSEPQTVDAVTLNAARHVMRIILKFDWAAADPDQSYFIFFHFISFYPFCAVFSLYEHVLTCTNPDDCEDDIASLDGVGSVMRSLCDISADLKPLSNTINALNKVSRSMQEYRRNHTRASIPSTEEHAHVQTQTHPHPTPSSSTPSHPSFQHPPAQQLETLHPTPQQQQEQQHTFAQTQAQQQPLGLNLPPNIPTSTLDTFNASLLSSPQNVTSTLSSFPSLQDFTNLNSGAGDVQPVDFIRALENDFMGRNWHEAWWDMDGGMDLDGTVAGAGAGLDGGSGEAGGSGVGGGATGGVGSVVPGQEGEGAGFGS